MFSLVYFQQNLYTDYPFLYLLSLIMCERAGKNNCQSTLLYASKNFRLSYIFNKDANFLDFCAQNYPLIFFNLNRLYHQQVQQFVILNYEKQHKEGLCKVLGRSVVFSAFYADFCLCPKSMIITTL